MADSPRNQGNTDATSDAAVVRNAGRRRLLQTGIAAAPVIMTVLSRPVLAQTGVCQAPSGFVSGNASNMAHAPVCMGQGIAFWIDYQSNPWPPGYIPVTVAGTPPQNATKFSDKFSPDLNPPGLTLLEVLKTTNSGAPYVARLCVATLLNVEAGWIPPTVLSVPGVQHIWNEYATFGVYHPTLTAVWSEQEIIAYLQTLMPFPG